MTVLGKAKILIVAATALVCGSARAGLVRAPCRPGAEASAPALPTACMAPARAQRLADINWLVAHQSWPFPRTLHATRYPPADNEEAAEAVIELPPAPSSLALVLSALAGVGAYQGVRSLKRLHLGFVPDWYHADAVQVGRVTPLQLEFDWSALPACVFDLPSDLRLGVRHAIPREHRSRFESEPLVPSRSPRSPPLFS